MLSIYILLFLINSSISVILFEDDMITSNTKWETIEGDVTFAVDDTDCPAVNDICTELKGNSLDYSSITSYPISTINYQHLSLQYDIRTHLVEDVDTCYAQYSYDNGVTWNNLANYTENVEDISFIAEAKYLTDLASNINNLLIRMYFSASNTDYCFISNIILSGDYITVSPTTTTNTNQPTTNIPTTSNPTTAQPTSNVPTTSDPTTAQPTTNIPTTSNPTYVIATSISTTTAPSTSIPTTAQPTTNIPTTTQPTTYSPTTTVPSTSIPTTIAPTTVAPTTYNPTTVSPTTDSPTYTAPTTYTPTTTRPTSNELITTGVPLNEGVAGQDTYTTIMSVETNKSLHSDSYKSLLIYLIIAGAVVIIGIVIVFGFLIIRKRRFKKLRRQVEMDSICDTSPVMTTTITPNTITPDFKLNTITPNMSSVQLTTTKEFDVTPMGITPMGQTTVGNTKMIKDTFTLDDGEHDTDDDLYTETQYATPQDPQHVDKETRGGDGDMHNDDDSDQHLDDLYGRNNVTSDGINNVTDNGDDLYGGNDVTDNGL